MIFKMLRYEKFLIISFDAEAAHLRIDNLCVRLDRMLFKLMQQWETLIHLVSLTVDSAN